MKTSSRALPRRNPLFRRAKILVIDDDFLAADLLRKILLGEGYKHVELETDAEKVIAHFRSFQPDLVVLDWVVPPLSGTELLRMLRAEISQTSYLPILVVTAHLQPEVKNEALGAGATDFLNKPYDGAEIVLRAGNLLRTRFLHLEVEEQNRLLRFGIEERTAELNKTNAALQKARDELELRVEERTEELLIANVALANQSALSKRAETALRESEERLRAMVRSMDDIVFEFDENGTYLNIWAADEALLARPKSECLGRTIPEVLGEETAAPFLQMIRSVMAERRPQGIVYELDVLNGRQWFSARVSPVFSSDGSCHRVCMLSREITEQKLIEQELRKTKDEAEQANAAKSEFLSRMSHELRTPLNAIIGFAQLAELDAETPEQHENVEQILRASTHLLQLINEVLNISRIEAGAVPVFLKPIPLHLTAIETFALVAPLAAEKNVRLDPFTSIYNVNADAQRLQQVLLNLLSNAIKYNKPGGRVTLACRTTSRDGLRIEVRDTGVGIESYELPRLFQPFQRLATTAETVEGIGLGLVICQRLIASMGGTIGVESERGVGSTFWFELPLATAMPDSEAMVDPPTAQLVKSFPADAKTLLYIEDNLPNLKLIERILAQRPAIKMITAQQGSMGLELARQHRPDLVVLDLHLPDMNGDQVLVWLRSEPRTQKIPVVVISADVLDNEVRRLKELGAHAYITKPFEVPHFLQVIDEILATPLSSPIATQSPP